MLAILDDNEQNLVMEIYDKYKKYIFSIAYDILKNQHDSEDVLNDVMIKIIKNIDKFAESSGKKMESLVVIFTRNTAIDHYRRNKKEADRRAPMYYVNEDGEAEQIDVVADEKTEEVVLSNENVEIMQKLLLCLPREDRELIELVCLHNFSYKEVAELLGVSVGVVGSRYMRAKKKLLRKLEEAHYEA